jgi:hypothetical protein
MKTVVQWEVGKRMLRFVDDLFFSDNRFVDEFAWVDVVQSFG